MKDFEGFLLLLFWFSGEEKKVKSHQFSSLLPSPSQPAAEAPKAPEKGKKVAKKAEEHEDEEDDEDDEEGDEEDDSEEDEASPADPNQAAPRGPYKMVLVIRNDLQMGKGKVAAQVNQSFSRSPLFGRKVSLWNFTSSFF